MKLDGVDGNRPLEGVHELLRLRGVLRAPPLVSFTVAPAVVQRRCIGRRVRGRIHQAATVAGKEQRLIAVDQLELVEFDGPGGRILCVDERRQGEEVPIHVPLGRVDGAVVIASGHTPLLGRVVPSERPVRRVIPKAILHRVPQPIHQVVG